MNVVLPVEVNTLQLHANYLESHAPVLKDPVGREALVPVDSLPGNQKELWGSPVSSPTGFFYHTASSSW